MTIYYVDASVSSSGAGTTWGSAFKTLEEGFTAANTVGDVVYISSTSTETLTVAKTYNVNAVHVQSNPLNIFSVNKDTGALSSGAVLTSNNTITFATATAVSVGVYMYGVKFAVTGTSGRVFTIGSGAVSFYGLFDSCTFDYSGNSSTTSLITIGNASSTNIRVTSARFLNCGFLFGNTAQKINLISASVEFTNCNMDSGTVHPASILSANMQHSYVKLTGCDLSNIANVVSVNCGILRVDIDRCLMKSGHTLAGTIGYDSVYVTAYDSWDSDTHGLIASSDYRGTLLTDTGIYCDDNISGNVSWKISSSSSASRYSPLVSPWISAYHSGTSAVTPYLEILRSGSSTAFTESEVWAEWIYKGTSGSTRATIGNDGALPFATPADQTASSKGAADWTGENATSWFGKIGPSSSITPAEAGDISFRICVGAPNTTVYVDPQIRGLS